MSDKGQRHSDKIIYYSSYSQDVVKSSNQNYRLKNDYKWINNNIFHKTGAYIIYGIAIVAGYIGCKLFFGLSYKNKKVLKECRDKGCLLYTSPSPRD